MIELYGCDELNVKWDCWSIRKIYDSPWIKIKNTETFEEWKFLRSSVCTFFHHVIVVSKLTLFESAFARLQWMFVIP